MLSRMLKSTAPPTAASGASERVPIQKAMAAMGSRVTKM
jgi:hypothetical protein